MEHGVALQPRMEGMQQRGNMSLFGGPLSTRAACVNTAALERLRQQAQEEKAKAEAKRLKALGIQPGSKPKAAPPPPPKDPVKERKEKLKSALNDFDDLNAEGPSSKPAKDEKNKHGSSGSSKGPGPSSTGAAQGKPGGAGPGVTGGTGSAPQRKHGRPLQTIKDNKDRGGRATSHSPPPPSYQADGKKAAGQLPPASRPDMGKAAPGAAAGAGAGPKAAQGSGGAGLTMGQGHQRQGAPGGRPGGGPPPAFGAPAHRGMPPIAGARMGVRGRGPGRPGGFPGRPRPMDEYDEYEDDFVVDEEEEEEDWRQEIRKLTGYDPRRFRDARDDDRSMEVGWRQITAEEKRSERLGRLEDQLEEQREAERLAAKSRSKKQRTV